MQTFRNAVMAELITKLSVEALTKCFAADSKEQAETIGKTVFNWAVAPYALCIDADTEYRKLSTAEKAAFVNDAIDEAYRLIIAPVLQEQPKGRDLSLPVMLMAHYTASKKDKGLLEIWRKVCEIVRLQHKAPLLSGRQGRQTKEEALTLESLYLMADDWRKKFSKLCKNYKL